MVKLIAGIAGLIALSGLSACGSNSYGDGASGECTKVDITLDSLVVDDASRTTDTPLRAHVTIDGQPVSGVRVGFSVGRPDRKTPAIVFGSLVQTDANGLAEVDTDPVLVAASFLNANTLYAGHGLSLTDKPPKYCDARDTAPITHRNPVADAG